MRDILQSNLLRKVFKSFTIYTITNLIAMVIPFMLLPILTRVLSPSDYGMLATFMAIVGIINVIAPMGSTAAVVRGYYDQDKEKFDFPQFVFNAIIINLIDLLISWKAPKLNEPESALICQYLSTLSGIFLWEGATFGNIKPF